MKPLIVINFKNYEESEGSKGLKIAAYTANYSNVIICPQFMEIDNLCCVKGVTVYAQHCDPILKGAHTGKISIHSIKKAGAKGTLLNHSENRIPLSQIKETIKLLRKEKMKTIVCAETIKEIMEIKKEKPDYIAYEPKQFIGTKTDITTIMASKIKEAVNTAKPVPLLIGAGIETSEQVKRAMKLGSKGVLIASGIIKNLDPRTKIRELATA